MKTKAEPCDLVSCFESYFVSSFLIIVVSVRYGQVALAFEIESNGNDYLTKTNEE